MSHLRMVSGLILLASSFNAPVSMSAAEQSPTEIIAATRDALAVGAITSVPLVNPADPGAQARLRRLAEAIHAEKFSFTTIAAREEVDCAVVLVEGNRPRGGTPDRFGLYLVHESAGWRLLNDPTRPYANDPIRSSHLEHLAQWVAEQARPAPVTLAQGAMATWMMGAATIDGRPLRPGNSITLNQKITLGTSKPGRLLFNELNASSINLSPGAVITMGEESVENGRDLVIDLEAGAIQVEVKSKGTYAHIRVRGFSSDVSVVGTIFLVQRLAKDKDYVAQVEGKVQVRRKGMDNSGLIELTGRQGVAVNEADGLGHVDNLTTRPQLTPEHLAKGDLQQQATRATTAADPDNSWTSDAIADQAPTIAPPGTLPNGNTGAANGNADHDSDTDFAPTVVLTNTSSAFSAANSDNAGGASGITDSQIGVANPGLGSNLGTVGGLTSTAPGSATGGSTSGGGTSAATGAVPLADHPGFPSN